MEQDIIQFEQLRQSIRQAQKTFEGWVAEQKGSMATQKKLHNAVVAEDKENVSTLQHTLQRLGEKESELQQLMAHEQEELVSLQNEVAELAKQREDIAQKKQALEAEIVTLKTQLDKERTFLATREEAVSRRALDAEKGVEFFQKRLALKLGKRKNGDLMLSFTQIDLADPARAFRIAVRVNERNQYDVTGCEPRIPDLAQMLATLNQTNNFSQFVVNVRRSFKQLVQA